MGWRGGKRPASRSNISGGQLSVVRCPLSVASGWFAVQPGSAMLASPNCRQLTRDHGPRTNDNGPMTTDNGQAKKGVLYGGFFIS